MNNYSNKSLHETFKDLINLQVDYNVPDISKQYLPIAKTIDIEQYLAYSSIHENYLDSNLHKNCICNPSVESAVGDNSVFHIVLSVKVSNESTLVPFFSIYNNGVYERDEMFDLGQEKIDMDFSSFLSSKMREFNYDYGGKEKEEVPCCSFKVEKEDDIKVTDFRFLPKWGKSNWLQALFPHDKIKMQVENLDGDVVTKDTLNNLKEGWGDEAINYLNGVLFHNVVNNEEQISFVTVFSNYYSNKGIDSLWYTFYNMDYDYRESADCLTRLMIISTDPYEVPRFLLCQLNKIREIASVIRSRYISDLLKKNLFEATKSAKAAIMSRNMSHNLGSHVMFYIKQRLESAQKILQTGVLKNLVNSSSLEEIKEKIKALGNLTPNLPPEISIKESIEKNIEGFLATLGDEMPILVGLGRFLNYLQERQDYIATVATDYIPYPSEVSFKDAIYDELKPDLRCKRHYGEAVGRNASSLLLKYIAYSEGFTDSDSIVLQFQDAFRGEGEVPVDLRQMNINLPGGTLGRQAFFSIMENIIRNAAKHDGSKVGKSPLVFRFDLLEPNMLSPVADDTFFFTGNENLEKTKVKLAYDNHCNDYYYLGITIVLGQDASDTVRHIGKALKKKYLTNEGQIDDSCKGIKEIRLSAAWIRGATLDTDISENEPPAVSVRLNDGNLQYIICLPKPKKVAFVLFDDGFAFRGAIKEYELEHKEVVENALHVNGSRVFVPYAYVDRVNNETQQKVKEKVFSDSLIKQFVDFDLIVLDSRIGTTDKSLIRSSVNSRIFAPEDFNAKMQEIFDETDVAFGKAVINETDAQHYLAKVIERVYHEWLKTTFGEKDEKGDTKPIPQLVINDGKAYLRKFPESSTDNGQNSTNSEDNSKYDDDLFKKGLVLCHSTDQSIQPGQLVYSKHYSGQENLKELYKQAGFLEGVSGGNSTDRLIRQDEWNWEWYVKQMAATLTKVAVIDERIFAKFVRQPDNLWTLGTMKDWLKKMSGKTDYGTLDFYTQFIEEVRTMFPFLSIDDWEPLYNWDNNTINIDDNDNIEALLKKIPTDSIDFSVANLNAQKGVWAFNIEISDVPASDDTNKGLPTVSVVGYCDDQIVEVAKFTKENDEIKDIFVKSDVDWKKFGFITIHQGILDKIYGAWNIKSGDTDEERERAKEEKESVIRAVFDCFSSQKPICIDEKQKSEFLPQFIIHSGRSKPNTGDMPQHQPFVQFAAIEHAINDCKYTLSELLYTAHYE